MFFYRRSSMRSSNAQAFFYHTRKRSSIAITCFYHLEKAYHVILWGSSITVLLSQGMVLSPVVLLSVLLTHRQHMIYVSPMSGMHARWFWNILLAENYTKVYSRRYDPPLPAAEDYSPLLIVEDLILHYLQRIWFSTTSKILLELQAIYSNHLPSRRCFCLLLLLLRAKSRELRAESQAPREIEHSSTITL